MDLATRPRARGGARGASATTRRASRSTACSPASPGRRTASRSWPRPTARSGASTPRAARAPPIPFTAAVEQRVTDALRFPHAARTATRVRARIVRWPVESPDGKRLVFSAVGHLYAMDLPVGHAAAPDERRRSRVRARVLARRHADRLRDLERHARAATCGSMPTAPAARRAGSPTDAGAVREPVVLARRHAGSSTCGAAAPRSATSDLGRRAVARDPLGRRAEGGPSHYVIGTQEPRPEPAHDAADVLGRRRAHLLRGRRATGSRPSVPKTRARRR